MSVTTLHDQTEPIALARHRTRARPPWGQVVLHVVLILTAAVAVMPLVWCIFASFKYYKEVTSSIDLLPHTWTLANYREVLATPNIWSGFGNTIVVTCSVTAVTVLTSTMAGYVFAKYNFWGKEKLFLLLLATMMVPGAVTLVPVYIIVAKQMHLGDQLGGIIITGLFSTFGIFMMRQFMFNLPSELLDAARIDGASEWRIFFLMVIPLSASPMAALGIFVFLGTWNDFLWPFVVLTSPDRQTLPLVLNGLQGYYWSRFDLLITAGVLTLIPLMVAYMFGSKYMIRGIAMTGLKM